MIPTALPPVMALAATKETEGTDVAGSRQGLPMTALVHRVTQKNSLQDKYFLRENSPTKQKM